MSSDLSLGQSRPATRYQPEDQNQSFVPNGAKVASSRPRDEQQQTDQRRGSLNGHDVTAPRRPSTDGQRVPTNDAGAANAHVDQADDATPPTQRTWWDICKIVLGVAALILAVAAIAVSIASGFGAAFGITFAVTGLPALAALIGIQWAATAYLVGGVILGVLGIVALVPKKAQADQKAAADAVDPAEQARKQQEAKQVAQLRSANDDSLAALQQKQEELAQNIARVDSEKAQFVQQQQLLLVQARQIAFNIRKAIVVAGGRLPEYAPRSLEKLQARTQEAIEFAQKEQEAREAAELQAQHAEHHAKQAQARVKQLETQLREMQGPQDRSTVKIHVAPSQRQPEHVADRERDSKVAHEQRSLGTDDTGSLGEFNFAPSLSSSTGAARPLSTGASAPVSKGQDSVNTL